MAHITISRQFLAASVLALLVNISLAQEVKDHPLLPAIRGIAVRLLLRRTRRV
jgi:hypothetical protein